MKAAELIDKYVMNTYARAPITFVRGQGCRLLGRSGQPVHRLFWPASRCATWATPIPEVAQAVCNQALKLVHVSNLYYTEPQAKVAELLVENSFADRVFFCNSGAEANEGALKLARKCGARKKNGRFHHHHHGTVLPRPDPGHPVGHGPGQDPEGLRPLVPRFKHVPFGDLEAVKAAWDDHVCAVLVEPVLGEGGVVVPPDYLPGLQGALRGQPCPC